jgi:hypothetical protein
MRGVPNAKTLACEWFLQGVRTPPRPHPVTWRRRLITPDVHFITFIYRSNYGSSIIIVGFYPAALCCVLLQLRWTMNAARRRMLESFRNGSTALSAALRRFPRKMWVYRESPNQPSIHETVCHLADTEVIEYVYCRSLVANPRLPIVEINSSAWSGSLGYFYEDIKEAMGVIRALRRVTYHFLLVLPEDSWTRTAELPVHGRVSLDEWLEIRESYLPEQIRRMERIHAAWCEATSATATSASKVLVVESLAS